VGASPVRASTPIGRLAVAFEVLGRSTLCGAASEADGRPSLRSVSEAAVDTIDGADGASITVLEHGHFATLAATDDRVRAADELQYRLGSGPCVDAILEDALFRPDDIRNDSRWPEFGRRVASDYGVGSMLAFRLFTDVSGVAAGLNVYGQGRGAFTDDDVSVGLILATLASYAVTARYAAAEVHNLEVALQTNREIGTAMGVLMAEHRVTREQAFGLLRMASQDANRKLSEIAHDVVDTGALELRRGRLRAGVLPPSDVSAPLPSGATTPGPSASSPGPR
jgi:hypothetical protein